MFIIWPTTHLFFSAFCADHRDPHVFSSSTTVKCRGIARKRFISKIIKIPRKNKCAMMVKATLNPCIYLHSPSMVHAFFFLSLSPPPPTACVLLTQSGLWVIDPDRTHHYSLFPSFDDLLTLILPTTLLLQLVAVTEIPTLLNKIVYVCMCCCCDLQTRERPQK